MKQISMYRYSVVDGEVVTITVTPHVVGPRVVATNNRRRLRNSGKKNKPVFKFTVDEMKGNTHFVQVDCSFDPADASDARYEITVRGSRGGGTFKNIRPVRKSHINRTPVFRFRVAAEKVS